MFLRAWGRWKVRDLLSTSSTGHRVAAHEATPCTKAVFVQKQLNSGRPFSVSQAAMPGTVDNVEHWSCFYLVRANERKAGRV